MHGTEKSERGGAIHLALLGWEEGLRQGGPEASLGDMGRRPAWVAAAVSRNTASMASISLARMLNAAFSPSQISALLIRLTIVTFYCTKPRGGGG